jgi:predicted regulator of Ras-like GTPase activity (Roadblock/LC7/MglB family)
MAGNIRRSLQELSEEVATNPNSTAFVELAAAYRERGDLERAMRLVVRQLAPDHLATRLALVRLYMDERRHVEADLELHEAERIAPGDRAVAELRQRRDQAQPAEASRGQSTSAEGAFRGLQAEHPGTLGVLLIDAEGQVIEGHMSEENGAPPASAGVHLVNARTEAERVASYLDLGELKGMVVESAMARLTISPVGRDVIIVATHSDLPAGQAARVVQRAWDIAEEYLSDMGR